MNNVNISTAKECVMKLIWVNILLTLSIITVVDASPMLVSKSYYTPVYKDANTNSDVVGNLLKNQKAQKVESSGGMIKINAFDGLIVGWVQQGDVAPVQGGVTQGSNIQSGASPVLPTSTQFAEAQSHAQPHQGGYQGVQYCVRCHNPGANSKMIPGAGKPIEIWSSSAHAEAYLTLFTPEAKEVGQKLGISSPHTSPKCLKCHVTGYGAPSTVSNKVAPTEGVGCETCHGPSGAMHKSGHALDVSKIETRGAFCERCHNNESPTWKGFNLEAFSKYIAHWGHTEEVSEIRKTEHQKATKDAQAAGSTVVPLSTQILKAPKETTTNSTQVSEGTIVLSSGVGSPVHFPHKRHQMEFGLECSSCHHIPKMYKCRDCHNDSSAVSRKKIFHEAKDRSCRGCHRSMASKGYAGPLTCNGCHVQ